MNATINDIPIDMDAGNIPAFSYRIVDIFEPGNVYGNKSTTFKVPMTNAAADILGRYTMAEDLPTDDLVLKIGSAGNIYIETPVRVIERSLDGYELIATGNNAGWIAEMRNKKLRDLELGISGELSAVRMVSLWDDEDELLCFPLINWGQILDTDTSATNNSPDQQRPAIRIYKVLENAFNSIGYTVDAAGRFANVWKKLIIPSTDKIQCANLDQYGAKTEQSSTVSVAPPQVTPFADMPQNITVYDDQSAINGSFNYVAPFDQNAHVRIRVKATIYEATSTGNTQLPVIFWVHDGLGNYPVKSIQYVTNYTLGPQDVDWTFDMPVFTMAQGREYNIRIQRYQPSAFEQFDINYASVEWVVDNIEWQEGVQIENASVLPQLTVMDLIKTVCTALCVVPQTNTADKKVVLKYYDDIFRGPVSTDLDLTDRMDQSPGRAPVKVTPVLPVRLEFNWKDDDNDYDVDLLNDEIEGRKYGNGIHGVGGGSSDAKIINLPFAATAMQLDVFDGITIPAIRSHDGTTDDPSYKWQPRILIADGLAPGYWTFDTVLYDEYPRAFFVNADVPTLGLAFEQEDIYGSVHVGTFNDTWRTWLRRHDRGTSLRCWLKFHDWELADMDMGAPVRVHDGRHDVWAHIGEIKQHKPYAGRYTECELIPE